MFLLNAYAQSSPTCTFFGLEDCTNHNGNCSHCFSAVTIQAQATWQCWAQRLQKSVSSTTTETIPSLGLGPAKLAGGEILGIIVQQEMFPRAIFPQNTGPDFRLQRVIKWPNHRIVTLEGGLWKPFLCYGAPSQLWFFFAFLPRTASVV